MVHEAMVLEYSGRHLALIELSAALKLLVYVSLIACLFAPWGIARPTASPQLLVGGVVLYIAKLAVGGVLLARVRDGDRQDARVPRAGIPRRGADAGAAGDAAALRVAELLDAWPHLRHRAYAGRLAGAGELHAALSGPAFGADQYFRRACLVLAASVAWQAFIQEAPHLYITAMIALVFKAIVIPVALRRIIVRLGIHREIETVVGVGPAMLLGIGLVALSMVVMLRVTADADPLAREDLAFALSVVLLGLLMMVTRRNAVSQVIGFMSLENGLVLAATGAKGMPLVVEISVAFSVLIAFIVIGIFLFRIRERFDTVDMRAMDQLPRRAAMMIDALSGVLLIPALSACLLAALPGYRLDLRGSMCWRRSSRSPPPCRCSSSSRQSGSYLLVDDLNKVFIVLTTFVSFTTSAFSASYIGHEIEIGRLKLSYVRFYHAMYQVLMFAMNLALVANNIGLMWVAIEIATLTTVLMVGIYRTHEALEAAWKYFILGSVGIALALFGTILIYMAARPVIGEGTSAMVWTVLVMHAAKFDPALLNVAFVFLLLGYGTKVGLAPLHAWLPDAHAEGPTPISAVLSGLLLNVALYALLRFKMLLALNPARSRPAR